MLFASEVGHRKGVDVLLAAWRRVREAVPTARLTLMGPLADPELVAHLPEGAVYVGSVSRKAVRDELARAAVAVLPSRAEAMPMFVLEAMAAGVPVVATPVGALPDVIGAAGRLVAVDDPDGLAEAVVHFLAEPAAAQAAALAARETVARRFSADAVFATIRVEYRKAFAE